MDSNLTRLTVLFEAPFWVGIFERIEGNTLSVCKVTFGAEPKDYEVLAYVLKNHSRLRFSPSQSAPGHSRRCSCSARRRSLKSRPARASSGKKKSSAALPAGSRNERKSTGANSWVYARQYCAKIDEAARNRMELIVRSLAEQNGVTEQLKAENQMEWVRQMNACKAQAEETVKAELIYD